ncbi:hypothetical protein COCMIDRAFT_91825 [Bipolaris oryzae ATCC 44560]|uniref:Uncharacterized protein n=1 Tax=Bipolaris oryzae ATCC 44560 TaxID=930090 RepID=W6ZSZ7_COCMI|nr:uncharacterized protein COCMIDRAFT_91825 [Bipolaris oryzae ATCC 44560]EUC46816.1 hypothetical protein COCMIDRAFT_91825 [Bipolaris oryzae ATCC 44560]
MYVVQSSRCSNSTQLCTSSHGKAGHAERRRLVLPSIARPRQTDVTSNTLQTNSAPPPDSRQNLPSAK